MQNLFNYVQTIISITEADIHLFKKYFVIQNIPANTHFLKAGDVERYIYFLDEGVVKGYQNIDGKIVIQHLVAEHDFFTSLDSFMNETPTLDYFETITDCKVIKISKSGFDTLQRETKFWDILVKEVTKNHLSCKQERVKDFQTLTAKERYLKFLKHHPRLALTVSIDNIASFLGMEPQSLSRIRKQITF
ncbi:Crp/Fnr family transcriptional regulator [Hyunsoonleella pacifica]|uniref:Crp/Fnr family transcriptional regulator n=1 Tax=Hyunsoonleella pacifica TaxID=1080224 RepID=A0A4Q9FSP7_9FLAO|nr:Crp/Fnr family transcriptional regulator [Hyunsoonleella pacifica]TBN16757.1 Crp/Fnr family transcriptional regulator [Hyunsoonleella pacifica]GGD16666.1 DNA-binding protein [Hyunsoonleella pacifica]